MAVPKKLSIRAPDEYARRSKNTSEIINASAVRRIAMIFSRLSTRTSGGLRPRSGVTVSAADRHRDSTSPLGLFTLTRPARGPPDCGARARSAAPPRRPDPFAIHAHRERRHEPADSADRGFGGDRSAEIVVAQIGGDSVHRLPDPARRQDGRPRRLRAVPYGRSPGPARWRTDGPSHRGVPRNPPPPVTMITSMSCRSACNGITLLLVSSCFPGFLPGHPNTAVSHPFLFFRRRKQRTARLRL